MRWQKRIDPQLIRCSSQYRWPRKQPQEVLPLMFQTCFKERDSCSDEYLAATSRNRGMQNIVPIIKISGHHPSDVDLNLVWSVSTYIIICLWVIVHKKMIVLKSVDIRFSQILVAGLVCQGCEVSISNHTIQRRGSKQSYKIGVHGSYRTGMWVTRTRG